MIFYIIAGLIVLYSFINFKNSVVACLAFKMFLNTNVTLISIPGIPILTLDLTLSLYFLILFFIKGKKYQNAKCHFPLFIPFCLIAFSWSISAIFGVAGLNAELSVWLKNFVGKILFIWMLWQIYETKEDFYKIFKVLTVVYLISCLYGLYEVRTSTNPLTEYTRTLNRDTEKVVIWDYSESGRGYRINSIFEHAIGAGIDFAVYAVFTMYLFLQSKDKIPYKTIAMITMVLSIICLLFTRSRTPLVFLAIGLLGLCNLKNRKTYIYLVLGLFFIAFVLPQIAPNTIVLFKSIFDSSLANTVGGSTSDLRFDQLLASFQLMSSSFLFGLGSKFYDVMRGQVISRLMGGESIWFQVIPSYGLIGLFAYIIELVYFLLIIPKQFKSRELFFWGLAYWVAITLSSTTGFLEYLYFLVMFYHIKRSDVYKSLNNGVFGIYFKNFKMHYGRIKG